MNEWPSLLAAGAIGFAASTAARLIELAVEARKDRRRLARERNRGYRQRAQRLMDTARTFHNRTARIINARIPSDALFDDAEYQALELDRDRISEDLIALSARAPSLKAPMERENELVGACIALVWDSSLDDIARRNATLATSGDLTRSHAAIIAEMDRLEWPE